MRGPFAPSRDALRERCEPELHADGSLVQPEPTVVQQQQQQQRQRQQRRRQRQQAARSTAAVAARQQLNASRNRDAGVTPAKKRLCHVNDRVVASAIMRCGLRIVTCHENPVVLA